MTAPVKIQAIPQAVLDAALALHRGKNTELTYSPFSTAGDAMVECCQLWHSTEDGLEFENLEARNHCTALATFQQVMSAKNPDVLFAAAHELWRNEIGHRDSASGRLLGFASQNMDVLMEAAKAIRSAQEKAFAVFEILRLLEVALPHLSRISAEAVVAVVDAQHESTKRDMARGMIFSAIERRLRSESIVAWEIWRIARSNMSESRQDLFNIALQALMHTDQQPLALEKARDDADNLDPLVAGAALWTLGRSIQAHELNDEDLNKGIAVLISKASASSTEIRQAATRSLAHASLKDERLMLELVRLAAEHDEYTLTVIADFLFMNQPDFSSVSHHIVDLLQSLVWLPPAQQHAINNFDWVLHQLYKSTKHRSLVLDCLTKWVVKHGDLNLHGKPLIESFDQTILQICNDESEFRIVITSWLGAEERQLAVACSGFISYLHVHGLKSPAFSREVLNTFSSQDFKFLARRLLGYVISEEALLSLTFSLLETDGAPERSFGLVYSLLTEEVGRDYPHSTMEALNAQQEVASSPKKELLAQIHSTLLQRSAAKNDLPRLQELRPPIRLQRAIALNRAREMEQAKELADEKSILRSIATMIPMKAGRGWFSVSNNQVGPTQHLQSFSHSISLPKRALTDPVGYAINGLLYRIAKRGEE